MPIDRDATLKSAEKLLRQGRLDAAIGEYVRLTAAHPGDWTSVNALGDLYVRAGQVERAIDQFARVGDYLVRDGALNRAAAVYRKILRLKPDDPRGVRGLSLVTGRQDAAAPVRRAAPAVAADDADGKVRAARELEDGGQTMRACALLVEAADLYEAQGRPSDALAVIAEASSFDPASVELRERLLKTLIAQGDVAQARHVARVVPELVMVADAFERLGKRAEALDTIAEAASFDPADVAVRERVLRQFVAAGEFDRARRVARTPADLLMVAEALNGAGRGGEMLEALAGAVDLEPHNAALREHLVRASIAAGDVPRARAAARTSRDWQLVADALRTLGRTADALAALQEAAQRDPHNEALHASYVRACLDAGDIGLARQAATATNEILEVAEALERSGDTQGALQMRAEALRRDPGDPQLRLRLIDDYMRTGARDRAHALLTPEVAGDDPVLLTLLARLEFGIGRLDEGRRALERLLAARGDRRDDVGALGAELAAAGHVDAAYVCAELAADTAAAAGEWEHAVAALQAFAARASTHVPILLKLIDVCVDGRLDRTMYSVQGQLVDAYLAAGQGAEARAVAEDLVVRAPWEQASMDRWRRALALCGDRDPDRTIADVLSGDNPFTLEDL